MLGGVRPFTFDAGIVEEAVDRAIGIECGFDISPHLGRFGDVGGNELRLPALLPDNPGGRLAARRVAIDDDNLGTAPGKSKCRGAADAVSRAGDQGDLVREIQIHGVPPASVSGCQLACPFIEGDEQITNEAAADLVGERTLGVELGVRDANQHLGLV